MQSSDLLSDLQTAGIRLHVCQSPDNRQSPMLNPNMTDYGQVGDVEPDPATTKQSLTCSSEPSTAHGPSLPVYTPQCQIIMALTSSSLRPS